MTNLMTIKNPEIQVKENYKYDVLNFNKWLDNNNKKKSFNDPEDFVNNTIIFIDEYLKHLQNDCNYKASTLAKKKIALKNYILNNLGNSKYDNILKGLIDQKFKSEVITYKQNDANITFLKRHEIEKLIDNSTPRVSLIIKTLFFTGMRISELTGILLKNCDISENQIKVRIIGKGHKERFIIIPKVIFEEINKVFNGKKYLFKTKSGKKYYRENIWSEISRQGKKILNKKVGCHQMRHSFGTY